MSRLKQLVLEVHRRSLWQVLAVYVGASWAVLEAREWAEAQYRFFQDWRSGALGRFNADWKRSPLRPLMRGVDDQVYMTVMDLSHLEAVLGSRGRSGGQSPPPRARLGYARPQARR